jgi:hypothetical protein
MIETDITMTCVSNEVGGKLVGNARWLGVPLADLLEERCVQDGATQIVGRSFDGWNNGFPHRERASTGATRSWRWHERRPPPHRARRPRPLVVPGSDGYVSATKWSPSSSSPAWRTSTATGCSAPGPRSARSDPVPHRHAKGLAKIPPGRTAWPASPGRSARHREGRGQIDDGEWAEARLADELTSRPTCDSGSTSGTRPPATTRSRSGDRQRR